MEFLRKCFRERKKKKKKETHHHQLFEFFLDNGAIVVSTGGFDVGIIKATFADASIASTTESQPWDRDALQRNDN